MTKFENEMRDFLSTDTLLQNKVFNDKTVVGELDNTTNVKLTFETTGVADNYYGVMVRIINKINGVIDTQFFKFNNIINKTEKEHNFYIWDSRGSVDWYSDRPTKTQKEMTLEDKPPGQSVSNMILGKSGGQLLIAPERSDWAKAETTFGCG